MPPRYAYWTIIVDDQPTAFRAGAQEDLLPTFKRLKEKQPTAKMMWFQNGKLWERRVDAQDAMRTRGELGRRGDTRQGDRPSFAKASERKPAFSDRERGSFSSSRPRPSFGDRPKKSFGDRPKPFGDRPRSSFKPAAEPREPREERDPEGKLGWKPKGEFVPAPKRSEKPDWKPKSDWKPKPEGRSFDRERKTEWKPKSSFKSEDSGFKSRSDRTEKPEWKPKGSFTPQPRRPRPTFSDSGSPKSDWKPKRDTGDRAPWKPKTEGGSSGSRFPAPGSRRDQPKLDWTPKTGHTGPKPEGAPKRKWVPKEEYKKSMGIEAKRDSKWRPGGEHKDPKQKYKDAKKAKWSKFKTNIRQKFAAKDKPKRDK